MNYLPGIALSLLFSLLIGFLFHFWKGGGFFRLLLILFLSIFGFLLGQWVGSSLNLFFMQVGWVNLGFGILGSIIFSFIAIWLTNIRLEK
jgi:hypothetical protein